MNWPALPFVRLLLPLLIGILIGYHYPIDRIIPLLAVLLLSGIAGLGWWHSRRIAYSHRQYYGLLLSCCLFSMGYLLVYLQDERRHPRYFRSVMPEAVGFSLRVTDIRESARTWRLQGTVETVTDSSGQQRRASGNLLVYLSKDSIERLPIAGERIYAQGRITPLQSTRNPGAFDFTEYMARRGYYEQAYVRSGDWHILRDDSGGWLRKVTMARTWVVNKLSQHLPTSRERAVAQALIIGQRDAIDDELRNAYAETGAIHVLAVSGLHVGIIYLVIGSLFRFLFSSRRWRVLRAILLLLFVWSYALLTGAAPPVVRAATMFSFLIIGQALYQGGNIYNSLAAAAFIMLCIRPRLLFDVGFQLSYLAVFGIVFFQARIYQLWYIPNYMGRQLWKLATVSIAAQLTTLPIGLYYFHQFPVYFWLSGWIVVPAATLILCLGLLLLLSNPIPLLASALGSLLYGVIWLMNTLIFYVQSLPLGLIKGISIGLLTVGILYTILFSLMIAWSKKQKAALWIALAGFILLGIGNQYRWWRSQNQQTLAVYHCRQASAIDIFAGPNAYCLTDLPADDHRLASVAENFRAARRIGRTSYYSFRDTSFQEGMVFRHGPFWQIGNTRLACLDGLPPQKPQRPLPLDYLIIRSDPYLIVDSVLQHFLPSNIVFDASNRPWKVSRWLQQCERLGLHCYDVGRRGAFVAEL